MFIYLILKGFIMIKRGNDNKSQYKKAVEYNLKAIIYILLGLGLVVIMFFAVRQLADKILS
jgi:hypothetical protein